MIGNSRLKSGLSPKELRILVPSEHYTWVRTSPLGQQQTISTVARQVCLQPHSGSQYASLASASRFTASDSPPE